MVERRVDPNDGGAFTRAEFEAFYGGLENTTEGEGEGVEGEGQAQEEEQGFDTSK